MRTLGVYHRTYHNKRAFEVAFKEFRVFFPESPYVIISDNGDDFSNYIDNKTFFIKSKVRLGGTGPEAFLNNNLTKWLDFYERIKECCEICKTDYMLTMEDDVLIKNHFVIDHDFDICGPCKSMLPQHTINFIEKFINRKKENYYYGLSGGAIFNTKKFLDNYDTIINNLKKYHEEYSNNISELPTLVGDGNFVTHFNLLNLDYECSKWLNNEIIHPFKQYYDK